VQRLATVSQWK